MKKCFILLLGMVLAACSGSPERSTVPEPIADARAMHELAVEAFEAGRYRDAITGFHGAERRFLSIDDSRGVAVAAISQAETQLLLGEDDDAAGSLQQAKAAIARIGNEHLHERAQLLAARLAMDGDLATARQLLRGLSSAGASSVVMQARLLSCELEMHRGETPCVANLVADDSATIARITHLHARATMKRGDKDTANQLLDHALSMYRTLAFRPGIAAVHETKAELAKQSNDQERAKEHLERALYLRLWIRDRVHSAELLARLAALANDDAMRERYRRWRTTLLDESREPDWDRMTEKLFNSR